VKNREQILQSQNQFLNKSLVLELVEWIIREENLPKSKLMGRREQVSEKQINLYHEEFFLKKPENFTTRYCDLLLRLVPQ
jgi:hypothetical protein